MPSNFEETSISRNAKRPYSPIFDLETFEAAVQKFVDDETMNFTKKEPASETYKEKIEYSAANGTDKGYLTYYAPDTTLETIETWADTVEEFGGEAA